MAERLTLPETCGKHVRHTLPPAVPATAAHAPNLLNSCTTVVEQFRREPGFWPNPANMLVKIGQTLAEQMAHIGQSWSKFAEH